METETERKVKNLLEQAKKFNREEDDGIRLSLISQAREICPHTNMTIEVADEYTADAREMKVEYRTCPLCGHHSKKRVWVEPVSEEAIFA
jgi:hypothetical protein